MSNVLSELLAGRRPAKRESKDRPKAGCCASTDDDGIVVE
jgi:hypothetical protein